MGKYKNDDKKKKGHPILTYFLWFFILLVIAARSFPTEMNEAGTEILQMPSWYAVLQFFGPLVIALYYRPFLDAIGSVRHKKKAPKLPELKTLDVSGYSGQDDHIIVLNRDNAVLGCAVSIDVSIDGRYCGKLKNGGVMRIPTTNGLHTIELTTPPMSGCGSKVVSVNVPEVKSLFTYRIKFNWMIRMEVKEELPWIVDEPIVTPEEQGKDETPEIEAEDNMSVEESSNPFFDFFRYAGEKDNLIEQKGTLEKLCQDRREELVSLNKQRKEAEERFEHAKNKAMEAQRELAALNVRVTDQEKRLNDALDRFLNALFSTSSKEMDWLKRAEKKELSIFEEMQHELDSYKASKDKLPASGYEFEEYCAGLLRRNGFSSVEVTSKSQDFGADVLAEKDGVKYVIQCKYYSSPVGIEAVQQIYGAKVHYAAQVAVVMTNNIFTKAAKTIAEETGVILWDCKKLVDFSP